MRSKDYPENAKRGDSGSMKAGPAFVALVRRKADEQGLLKRVLAKKLGITPSTLSSYMTMRAAFPFDLLVKVSKVLDIPYNEAVVTAYGLANCIEVGLLQADSESAEEQVKSVFALAHRRALHDNINATVKRLNGIADALRKAGIQPRPLPGSKKRRGKRKKS